MAAQRPASPPEPPYYAVIFAAQRTPGDNGYAETSERMVELGTRQPGFLGMDSTRGPDGFGITVTYWRDEESIAAWRRHAEHVQARGRGHADWYESVAVHVARVERSYAFQVR